MIALHIDEQRTWRGGEQQASWLVQGLAAAGHRVILAGRPGAPWLEDNHGGAPLERVALPLRNEFDLASAWALAGLVRRHEVDILHAHTSHAHSLACLARRIAGRGKVVVHRRVSFAPKRDPFNRLKYAAPDRIVAVSRHVGDVLLAAGIPRDKVRVVHSAVELARLEATPIARAALGVPEGVPLLFSAGALVGHKDHACLLDAMALVLRDSSEARLLIAGEGELRPQIEGQIARLHLADRVQLLGHRSDVPALLRAADAYVSSSWSEGLGTSVLEALAAEIPVIATDAGGVSEMVLDGQTGRFLPNRDPKRLAEAILATLRAPEQARSMARAGRAHVEAHFTVPSMVAGNIAVYEELLAPPR